MQYNQAKFYVRICALLCILTLTVAIAGQISPSRAADNDQIEQNLRSLRQNLNEVKNQLVVVFSSRISVEQARNKIRATGGKITKSSTRFRRTYLAVYPDAQTASRAYNLLKTDSNTVNIFFNRKIKVPSDIPGLPVSISKQARRDFSSTKPAWENQGASETLSPQAIPGNLGTFQWSLQRIGYDLAPSPTSNAPVVAVIDTGVDYNHPDIEPNYMPCPATLAQSGFYCDVIDQDNDPMDAVGHGTHVAGIIAAADDSFGTTGVSPKSKILAVRIFDDLGYTDLMTIFAALDYVRLAKTQIPDLKVANMSWGGYADIGSPEYQEMAARISALRNSGILPVASAGNDSDNPSQYLAVVSGEKIVPIPAALPGVLSVAATDYNDYRAFFSNYSTPIKLNDCQKIIPPGDYDPGFVQCSPDNTYTNLTYNLAQIAAPGWQVLAPTLRGQYVEFSGTSMASPMVAGAAARVMSQYPAMTVGQVQDRLISTGQSLGISKGFPIATPRLDLRRALGVSGTGITGRVVDGFTGIPIANATVSIKYGNTQLATTTTDKAGFYTFSGLAGSRTYTITANRAGYIANSRNANTVSGQYLDPGDLSLAPLRNDGSYTFMLEWNNVATGFYEWQSAYFLARGYPWPVNPASMPMALLDTYISVPAISEPNDVFVYNPLNKGTTATYPYVKVLHDSEYDITPHEGAIVRQLSPSGKIRYGVEWLSPGGYTRPNAMVSIYRNGVLVRRAQLSLSNAPTDGTSANASRRYAHWALYAINSQGNLSNAFGESNGQRSSYHYWVYRNGNIPGVPGPGVGQPLTAYLELADGVSGGPLPGCNGDCADVYRYRMVEGRTYSFTLSRPASTSFQLELYAPNATSIAETIPIKIGEENGDTVTLQYTVPRGRTGTYYLAVVDYMGSGPYTLVRQR